VSPETASVSPLYPSLLRPTQTLRLAVSELASARRAAADGRLDSAHVLLRSARALVQSAERLLERALVEVEAADPAHKCLLCDSPVGDGRVYFGIVGPFCDVQHRTEWLATARPEDPQ
jgi:hypothetical protein